MPLYHTLGEVPRKRHCAFRKPDGGLYAEELIGNKGFVGPSSLLYHLHPPTQVLRVQHYADCAWECEPNRMLRHRHFRTRSITTGTDPAAHREPLLFNHDVALSVWAPQSDSPRGTGFYRNAQGDEIFYVSEGDGTLQSQLGDLPFRAGDYVVIPRGILYRLQLGAGPHRFLIIESAGYVRTPKRYRNEHGQLIENAPFSERDIRRPQSLAPHDEKGEFTVFVKKENRLTEYVVAHHPFDVVGWDGYYFPWAFNIHDFEPRVGRFHLPPPIHQTFEGDNFVVCSFCPRPYDFDPNAVPAPYNHSNVMSDEVLYYANSEFMSRKGIEYASVTLHPDGIPHGPQPGRTEASIGQKETNELAVMVDTFRPLFVSKRALDVEDKEYYQSWLPDDGH
jgi:homogentisate 1,2-dioxygenase